MTIARWSPSYAALTACVVLLSTTRLLAAGPADAAPPPSPPPSLAKAAPAAVPGAAVFPAAVSPKYASEKPGTGRRHTCLDQYHANKSASGNGGLNWVQKGGGYYSACLKKLKG